MGRNWCSRAPHKRKYGGSIPPFGTNYKEKIMEENGWIDYLVDGSEPPTEGFVEIIDTFFGERRHHFMDMNVESADKILWNKSAPRCVSKYRFVPETKYLEVRIQTLEAHVENQKLHLLNTEHTLKETQNRLNYLLSQEKA